MEKLTVANRPAHPEKMQTEQNFEILTNHELLFEEGEREKMLDDLQSRHRKTRNEITTVIDTLFPS